MSRARRARPTSSRPSTGAWRRRRAWRARRCATSSPTTGRSCSGEIALYAFVVLVATGVYLALFFSPDVSGTASTTARSTPLQGAEMTRGLPLDARPLLDVPGRAAHAPDPPLGRARLRRRDGRAPAARLLHRRVPRAARAELADRRRAARRWACSRASPATRCPTTCSRAWAWRSPTGVALSIPCVGGSVGALVWGGQFPGAGAIESRLYIAARLRRARRHGRADRAAPGARRAPQAHPVRRARAARAATWSATPMWPGYALRSLGPALRRRGRARRCSAASCRSTRSGSGAPTSSTARPTAPSPTGTWAGSSAALRLMPPLEIHGLRRARSCPTRSGAASPSPASSSPARRVAVDRAAPDCATARGTTSSTARATTRGAPPSASPSSAGWR